MDMDKKKKIKRKLNSWEWWDIKLIDPYSCKLEKGLALSTIITLFLLLIVVFLVLLTRSTLALIAVIVLAVICISLLIITIMELRDNNEEYYKEKNLRDSEEKKYES